MIKVFVFSIVLANFISCGEKTENKSISNDLSTNDTLLVKYDGVIRVYTMNGLIDSSGLTQLAIEYLTDSSEVYFDSVILMQDSFSMHLKTQGQESRLLGHIKVDSLSICFHFDSACGGVKCIPFDSTVGFSSDSICFLGNRTRFTIKSCQQWLIQNNQGTILKHGRSYLGDCIALDMDSLRMALEPSDTLTTWQYEAIFE